MGFNSAFKGLKERLKSREVCGELSKQGKPDFLDDKEIDTSVTNV